MENNSDSPNQSPLVSQNSPRSSKPFIIVLAILLIVAVGVGGYILGANQNQIAQPPPQLVPTIIQPSPTQTITSTPMPSEATIAPIKSVPLISTSGWKAVANNGIAFMIPPEATCNNDTACSTVTVNSIVNSKTVPSYIYVKVRDYHGESLRETYTSTHTEILNCDPLYVETIFGTVKALQIAAGDCSGNTGGMVTVINNKLVTIDGGLWYDLKTK
ncbi:MAG: hypothetical protein AAB583_05135, partial [Patescibacteria group bacterium]